MKDALFAFAVPFGLLATICFARAAWDRRSRRPQTLAELYEDDKPRALCLFRSRP